MATAAAAADAAAAAAAVAVAAAVAAAIVATTTTTAACCFRRFCRAANDYCRRAFSVVHPTKSSRTFCVHVCDVVAQGDRSFRSCVRAAAAPQAIASPSPRPHDDDDDDDDDYDDDDDDDDDYGRRRRRGVCRRRRRRPSFRRWRCRQKIYKNEETQQCQHYC
jgi:hypothetical protein